ncbi:acyl-CoA N-acyltransferase [Xylaria bambusicola]|uniref:acyl-CoA N-acyltransferase n=1 Tax=Xylaria bambusicola TaxID=326684 RepID=UPI0020072995|nr:acyl-CoA N-acyltransferase [Xylaria bambusicola]KAI0505708.1 acyl-CoA N-acyltransferase [Xylaria bambusicola]
MKGANETAKRKRAFTDPIEKVNQKSDGQFIKEHLCPSDPSWTSWAHPSTHVKYSLSLVSARRLSSDDLDACYRLIEETSRVDYEASTTGWKPGKKIAEMKSPELRYILVKNEEDGVVRGFTSLMPTYEEGEPVVYCYEIHLASELQRTGLGRKLMSFLESVASHTPPIKKVMLTCFLSNKKALGFYESAGFTKDHISPVPKKLRYGREFIPDYAIMSKTVDSSEAVLGPPPS